MKVQSACWHCCCQVCPFSVFSKMPYLLRFSLLRFDEHYKTAGFGRVVFFFSFPRDPELRKTRSKSKVTVAVRREEGKHQFTKKDRGDVGLTCTADDQIAPGVVRLRAMYLTQHCMLRKSVPRVCVLRCNVWNG